MIIFVNTVEHYLFIIIINILDGTHMTHTIWIIDNEIRMVRNVNSICPPLDSVYLLLDCESSYIYKYMNYLKQSTYYDIQ